MKKIKRLVFGAAVVSILAIAPSAFAQNTSPIDDLETEMAKLEDVYDEITPVAIGAAAFSIGMILIKRVAFS